MSQHYSSTLHRKTYVSKGLGDNKKDKNTMKANLKSLVMLLMVACSCMVGFSSCSSDDDNNSGSDGGGGNSTYYTGYAVKCNETLLQIADVKVTYTDLTGKEQTATITDTLWIQPYSRATKGTTMKMTVASTLKSGLEYTDDTKFTLTGTYGIYENTSAPLTKETFEQSAKIGGNFQNISSIGIKGSRISDVITRLWNFTKSKTIGSND